MDLIYLIGMLVLFSAMAGLAHGCAKLVRRS